MKRTVVIAHAGRYPDGTIRPPEELEAAVKRVRTVPLTLGHPPKDRRGIPENMLLGKVDLKYDETGQRHIGEVYFYREYFDRVPEHIRQKIVNLESFPISPGFTVSSMDDNVLRGIVPEHVAVLTDEKPLCPLTECGVNVRMESGHTYRYEQRTEATDPTETPKEPPKKEAVTLETLQTQIAELKATIAGLKASPVVEKTEEKKTPVEVPTPEAPRVTTTATTTPRKVIPAGETKSEDELKYDARGMIILG